MLTSIKQLKLLTAFQMVMILTDFALTNFALGTGRFYETNTFTNTYGLLSHTLILVAITYILFMFAKREVNNYKNPPFATFLMTIISTVWFLNNMVSVYLIAQIL